MKKQWLLVIVALVVVFGGIFGGKFYAQHQAAVAASQHSFPPVAVATAVVKAADWSPEVSAVGTLEAVSGTEITAQIAGNITRIAFQSGMRVKKGDLLVRVNDTTQLAQLHADLATLQLAQANLKRTSDLYKAHATSLLKLQTAKAKLGTAQAAVEGDHAILRKLHIRAPFDGVVGIREVSLGQYVAPGTAIVDLQSYDPIFLNFSLPQSTLPELQPGRTVQFSVDAYPGQSFAGKVTAVDSRVDPATRNVNIQATLDNPQHLLRPGLYGEVSLSLGAPLHGVEVPNTAIAYSTFGDTVFVVQQNARHKRVAHAAIVQIAERRNGRLLLGSGVKAGDIVVVAGQNKLRDGVPVAIDNRVKP